MGETYYLRTPNLTGKTRRPPGKGTWDPSNRDIEMRAPPTGSSALAEFARDVESSQRGFRKSMPGKGSSLASEIPTQLGQALRIQD